MTGEDKDLGMNAAISRRDFVQGIAAASATLGLSDTAGAQRKQRAAGLETDPGNYPPLRTGMRGAHPGAFESAHALRDGDAVPGGTRTGETYDLVVVGGGLSGLAAAWFYRQRAGGDAKILILDNHDDFGGHAKRNEFVYNGRKLMTTGGSSYFVGPDAWTTDAISIVNAMGVDWREQGSRGGANAGSAMGLQQATMFRKEVYGRDQLVVGGSPLKPTADYLARTPLPQPLQAEILRLYTGKTDYLAGMSEADKIAKLRSISYRDYLLTVAKFPPAILDFTAGVWCLGNDMASAWMAFFRFKPGFDGLGLTRPPYSPEGPEQTATDYTLPGGNSDLARLLVRALVPESLPGGDWKSVETARTNYATLDRAGAPTRIRLSSIVLKAIHVGNTPRQFESDGREVEMTYVQGGRAFSVRGKDVVMAGMNNMVPYICPEMPDEQKVALHKAVRAANQTTNVLFRNWEAFARLKTNRVMFPRTFYEGMSLNFGRDVGGIAMPQKPDDPIIVGFSTAANSGIAANPTMVSELLGGQSPSPGTPMDDQFRMIRAGLLQTEFAHFERAVRTQAAAALGGGGFDPARDILAITVNRWPHGFATGRNTLFDPVGEGDVSPTVVASKRFGRIAIANSDSTGVGIAQTALDAAARAVRDLETRNYGYYETF
ncbi:MAG: NAD(P)/FAD-dependent oxidoreductase [Sphingomonas fennica]